jgi:hypothetical protein
MDRNRIDSRTSYTHPYGVEDARLDLQVEYGYNETRGMTCRRVASPTTQRPRDHMTGWLEMTEEVPRPDIELESHGNHTLLIGPQHGRVRQ